MIRQAGETGQLYGSVSSRDVADALANDGYTVARSQVSLAIPIKTVGLHTVALNLHAEVAVTVTVNVARSEDEAARQAKGEDLTVQGYGDDEDEAVANAAAAAAAFAPPKARKPRSPRRWPRKPSASATRKRNPQIECEKGRERSRPFFSLSVRGALHALGTGPLGLSRVAGRRADEIGQRNRFEIVVLHLAERVLAPSRTRPSR